MLGKSVRKPLWGQVRCIRASMHPAARGPCRPCLRMTETWSRLKKRCLTIASMASYGSKTAYHAQVFANLTIRSSASTAISPPPVICFFHLYKTFGATPYLRVTTDTALPSSMLSLIMRSFSDVVHRRRGATVRNSTLLGSSNSD